MGGPRALVRNGGLGQSLRATRARRAKKNSRIPAKSGAPRRFFLSRLRAGGSCSSPETA
jgi:hypothetical protein